MLLKSWNIVRLQLQRLGRPTGPCVPGSCSRPWLSTSTRQGCYVVGAGWSEEQAGCGAHTQGGDSMALGQEKDRAKLLLGIAEFSGNIHKT